MRRPATTARVTAGIRSDDGKSSRQSADTSFGFLDHTFQRGYLPEEFRSRLRRAAEQHRAGRRIGNDPRLSTDLGTLSDPQVLRHAGLAADLNEIVKGRGARDPNLGNNDAAASQADVMADLD